MLPCVHRPSQFLAPTLQSRVPSAATWVGVWDGITLLELTWDSLGHGEAGMCPSELVCSQTGPGSPPAHPRNHWMSPLEAGPRAAQAPGGDAKGKPGVLGFGTAPEWTTLLISAFPPHSPPHPSSQLCWTLSIPAAMTGTLWRAERELCTSGRSEFLLGNLPIPPPGSISFPPHTALGYFPAVSWMRGNTHHF